MGCGFTKYFTIADDGINRIIILLLFNKIDVMGVTLDLVNRFKNVIYPKLPTSKNSGVRPTH